MPSSRNDDDEDDDRPRRRRKKPQKSSNTGLFIALGLGGVLVLAVVGIIVGVVVFGGSDSDTAVASNNSGNTQPPLPPPSPPTGGNGQSGRPSNPAPSSPKSNGPDFDPGGTFNTSGPSSVKDVYQYVLKSTALILNVAPRGISNGTGSVVDVNARLILTNYHVVANAKQLFVIFPIYEGEKLVAEKARYLDTLKKAKGPEDLLQGEIIASDPQRDLALIQVPKLPPGIETLPLAKADVNIGQTVHSIGNPGVSDALWVYTQGAVRAVYRKKWKTAGLDLLLDCDSEVVETQSPTNPGDSGGPLVNDRGELVGVTEGYSAAGRQISIFISLNEARDFIEKTYKGKFAKAWTQPSRAPLRVRGGSSSADLTELIAALDHADPKIRARAAQSLGDIGPDAKLAIRRLVKALKDPDELTRRASAGALSKIGAPNRDDLMYLTDALKDSKPEVRRYAAAGIGQIGPEAASAAEKVSVLLSDSDETVRETATRTLGSLGPNAKDVAIPALTKVLTDSSKNVRVAAASSMSNLLTPPKAEDVPALVMILKQKDPEASVFGARALAKLGKQAQPALADLIEVAKSSDSSVRRSAIDALAAIQPDAKSVTPVYIAALKDSSADSGVRQSALLAIGQLGDALSKDKDAIDAVLSAATDRDKQVKKAAMAAVGKLGPAIGAPGAKEIMPAIIEALQDKEAQDQALETISGLGPLARDAVSTLITVMEKQEVKLFRENTGRVYIQDADEKFLDKIAKALGKIGSPAVKSLLRSLATDNVNVGLFIGACRALGEIGPPAKAAVLPLVRISQANLPPPICVEADRAIRKIRK